MPVADQIDFVADDAIDFVPDKEFTGPSVIETAIPGVFSDMASGEGPGAFDVAMQPIVELPAVPAKFMQGILSPMLPGQMGAQIGEGAGRFVSKAASSLLSPGMMVLGGIGAVAPPVAGAVIASMGAAGLGPAAVEALEASKRGDVAGFTESALDAGMAGLMASGGARGVARAVLPAPKPPILPIIEQAKQNNAPLTAAALKTVADKGETIAIESIPGVEKPPVPETEATTQSQMQMLAEGKRKAVLITAGEQIPTIPQGMDSLPTLVGTFIFDPAKVTRQQIEGAVFENRVGDVLDYGIPAKPTPGTEVGAVVVRAADGTEKQAVVTDQANLPSVTAAADAVKSPGDTVGMETAEQVIRGRQAEPATPSTGLADTPRSKGTGEELFAVGAESSPEMVGMGGAVPSEFQNPRLATAMKYKLIDAERQQRGLEPLIKPEGLSDQVAMDKAMAKMDANPKAAEDLIGELEKNPRPIEDWENHLLLLRKIDLRNEYGRATRELAQAFEDGRLDDVAALRPRVQIWSDQLSQLEQVSRASGSARGRALRALRVMANEDFSLAQMEMEKRADVGGRPLTDIERVELVSRQKELEATNLAFQARVAELESLQRQAELDKSLAEAKAAAAKTYPPSVLDAAERIVSGWEKRAESASARLKSKLAQLGAAPDPTIVLDVAEIGLAKFGRGVLDFAKWSEAMIADFGPKVEPFLKDAFDAAQKLLTLESDKIKGPISEQVKRKIKNVDVADKITGAKEKIGAKLEQGDDANVTPSVRQLVRALVEQDPKITRDQLVDTVHDVLKEFVPEMSRIEAMDAISGRGKFWLPPQDVVSKTVRDLSTQIRLVAHQQDVLAKKPLPRTGYQPEPMSDIARQEQQKLNDLKRRHGVVVTDPASQLASTLAARKTYYTHRLADLRQEIVSGERIVKSKSPSPTDPALESLKAEYETTKAEHDAIFGKREMTDAQRVQIAMNAVEKSITDLETRIEAGDIGTRSRASKTPNTPELEAARARRDALQEELQELRDLAEPKKTPEEIALQSLRARLARENANLRDRMARGDFSPKPKAPPIDISKDTKAMSLAAEHEKLKRDYQQSRAKDQAARMTVGQKAWANAKEASNLYRAFKTAFDVSAVLRQGAFFTLGHPIQASRAIGVMLKGLVSEKSALIEEQRILHRPKAPLYARDKLYLPSLNEARLSAQEEMIMSRLAPKIPGIRASNRAYITFLNRLRADMYDTMADNLPLKDRGNPTPSEGRAIAEGINTGTGRGSLGRFEASGELMATFLFSARLLVSRFQLLAAQPMYGGTARTRLAFAREYAQTLVGLGVVYSLAELAGAHIEDDSRSSDFGKFKWGHSRLDPLFGLQQVTVLLSRLVTGETKILRTGKVSPIRGGKVPFGGANSADVIGRFLRTKIAPLPGDILDVISGENVIGEKVTAASKSKDVLVPIAFGDIFNVMKDQGIPAGTALELLNLFGMGLQHFDEKERRK